MLGPEVMMVTSNHPRSATGSIARAVEYLEIDVGPRCWLGARTTLLPGVRIGEGTVVAAGAVVTESCEAGGTMQECQPERFADADRGFITDASGGGR